MLLVAAKKLPKLLNNCTRLKGATSQLNVNTASYCLSQYMQLNSESNFFINFSIHIYSVAFGYAVCVWFLSRSSFFNHFSSVENLIQ